MATMIRWDLGAYGLELACNCKHRSAECAGGTGFHLVDTSDRPDAWAREVDTLALKNKTTYRVVERATGRVLSIVPGGR